MQHDKSHVEKDYHRYNGTLLKQALQCTEIGHYTGYSNTSCSLLQRNILFLPITISTATRCSIRNAVH